MTASHPSSYPMRQLSNLETGIMLVGGLLMVVGAGASIFLAEWAAYVFGPGALMFTAIQLRQSYEGRNFAIRRLRRMIILSDVLFLVAALLMLANATNFLGIDYLLYIKYVHNNWIVVLLVAAILQLYAGHRIANEMEKEAKKR